jgi:hypothetical protein
MWLKEAFAKMERGKKRSPSGEPSPVYVDVTLTPTPPPSHLAKVPNKSVSLTSQAIINPRNMSTAVPNVLVKHTDAEAFVVALLEASGVTTKNAEIVARGLVQADLRGVESHGICRIPSYLARIRNGVLDPKAEPTLTQVTPVVAQVSRG